MISSDLLFPCADWIFAQFKRHILKCASIKKLEKLRKRVVQWHLWHIYISHPKGTHNMIYQAQRNFKFFSVAISHQTRKNKSCFRIWTGIRDGIYRCKEGRISSAQLIIFRIFFSNCTRQYNTELGTIRDTGFVPGTRMSRINFDEQNVFPTK